MPITKEELYKEYFINQKTLTKISKEYHVGHPIIFKVFKEYGFKLRSRVVDISGKRYGHLEVKGIAGKSKEGRTVWNCICICGNQKVLSKSQLDCGQHTSCGCQKRKKYLGEMCGEVWNKYLYRSKVEGIELNISKEYAYNLYLKQNKKCYYTGLDITFCYSLHQQKKGVGPKQTASLDRKDNNLGYIEGNVVWVHKNVNAMKNCLSHEDFIKICHLVSGRFEEPEKIEISDTYMPHTYIKQNRIDKRLTSEVGNEQTA